MLQASPAASYVTGEDPKPKHLQNEQSKLGLEPTDDLVPLRASPQFLYLWRTWGQKSLLDEAYNALRKMDSKLIDAYEKDLLASQEGTSMRNAN